MGENEKEELFRASPVLGDSVCRLCGKCLPCPEGIDIVAKLDSAHYKLTREVTSSIPV